MKTLMLASTFCLALNAQQIPQLISPQPNIGVWQSVQGGQRLHQVPPSSLALTFKINDKNTGACSAPLLEARVDRDGDPGMAVTPSDSATMPQANVPAPVCGTLVQAGQIVVLRRHTPKSLVPLNDQLKPIIPPYIRLVPPLTAPKSEPKP